MKALVAFVSLLAFAAAASPPARAGPVDPAVCVENAILIDPLHPLGRLSWCLQGAVATDPLCMEVYDAAAAVMTTFPCATTCSALGPSVWHVLVGLNGSPGDSISGVLTCGAPAVTATATAGAGGGGIAIQANAIPANGNPMACHLASPAPASVISYAAVCNPSPVPVHV